MRKLFSAVAGLVLAFGLASLSANAQTIALGPSTSSQGILFTGGSGNGSLGVQIGACPVDSLTCTSTGPVTGNLAVGATLGGTQFLYGGFFLGVDTLNAASSGTGNWNLSGGADGFDVNFNAFEGPCSSDNPADPSCLFVGTSSVSGTIDWTGLLENSSGNFLRGTATFTNIAGELSNYISDGGTASFTVQLSSLTCAGTTGPCSLAAISGELADPPTAFGTLSSGSLGGGSGPSPTPEPGTLLLLGSGLVALGFIGRKLVVCG